MFAFDDRYGKRRFGMAEPGTLLGETPDARRVRREAVRGLVGEVFGVAVAHFGEEEARQLWSDIPPPRKIGAKRGSRDNERDEFLLALYDYVIERGEITQEAIPAHLGAFLEGRRLPTVSRWRCQSSSAIEKMIRRLLDRRANARGVVTGLGETLLGSAGQKSPDN